MLRPLATSNCNDVAYGNVLRPRFVEPCDFGEARLGGLSLEPDGVGYDQMETV